MRKRIYEIIELGEENDKLSMAYDSFMVLAIIISIIPLWTHQEAHWLDVIDKVTAVVFILDYILRLITADIKLKRGFFSFVIYPFTAMAIIDIMSILPSLSMLPRGYKRLRQFRFLRALKVLRTFKFFRYSANMTMIANVFRKKKDSLLAVVSLALAYILISAMVIFNAEPETFETMYDAIYWATISLTTVGYGDSYAISEIGKFITMISAFLGVAVVALPAGIIMSGYQDEMREISEKYHSQEKAEEPDNK